MTPAERSPAARRQAPVWIRDAERERERPPALTRERVVATAIAIADRDGLDAVSIRRVAAELSARPMSLYAHFETKDDLLELMNEAVIQEALIEGEIPLDWREALRMIARHARTAILRHHWLASTVGSRPLVSPAVLRHADQSLAAVRTLDVDVPTKWAIIRAVDNYTLGHVMAEIAAEEGRPSTADAAERGEAVDRAVRAQIDDDGLAHLTGVDFAALLRDDDAEASFERGLDWLLAGCDASLGAGAPPA